MSVRRNIRIEKYIAFDFFGEVACVLLSVLK